MIDYIEIFKEQVRIYAIQLRRSEMSNNKNKIKEYSYNSIREFQYLARQFITNGRNSNIDGGSTEIAEFIVVNKKIIKVRCVCLKAKTYKIIKVGHQHKLQYL